MRLDRTIAADWLEFADLFPPSVDLPTIDILQEESKRGSMEGGRRSASSGQSAAVVLSNHSAFSYVTHGISRPSCRFLPAATGTRQQEGLEPSLIEYREKEIIEGRERFGRFDQSRSIVSSNHIALI